MQSCVFLFTRTAQTTVASAVTENPCFKHLHLFVLHLFVPLHPHFKKPCPPLMDVWITAWRREIAAPWLTSFSVKSRSGQTSN